jgi:hypothetical protein
MPLQLVLPATREAAEPLSFDPCTLGVETFFQEPVPSRATLGSLASPRKLRKASWQGLLGASAELRVCVLAELVALSVEDFEFAKKRGLRFNLSAVAYDNNLHVRRIEIFARRFEQIIRR